MIKISLITLVLLIVVANTVEIKEGKIFLTHKQLEKSDEKISININSETKNTLTLNQDSKLKLQVQIQFSQSNFIPELFAFRLKHELYNNLSEPVLATYNSQNDKFTANLDLGNPKQIKPYSGTYYLEIVVSDDKLTNNMKKNLILCNVQFRAALQKVPASELAYSTEKLILTTPAPARVDPPQTFTIFIIVLMLIVFVMFLAALKYLNVNGGLFPTDGAGILWNLLFIFILVVTYYILVKFWLSWNFITTLKYLLVLIIPSIIVANNAFVHLKKQIVKK